MKKLLLFFIISLPLFATVNISLPEMTASGGDTLNYPVFVSNINASDSVTAGHFWISITDTIINPIQVTPGDLINDWGIAFTFDSSNLIINISLWGGSMPVGSGVLFYIKFLIGNPDTTTVVGINIDRCYLLDPVSDSIPLTVDSGAITVTPVAIEEQIAQPTITIRQNIGNRVTVSSNFNDGFTVDIYGIDGRLEKEIRARSSSLTIKNLSQGIHVLFVSHKGKVVLRRKIIFIK